MHTSLLHHHHPFMIISYIVTVHCPNRATDFATVPHTLFGVYQFVHTFFTSVSISLPTSLSTYLMLCVCVFVCVCLCIDR